ncbi:MAG: acetate/propionate family kinase [Myxococcales bacterium]|nr:MAG: acetate/propionate family kinase [Myxococcales bacterium]
MLVLNAGSASLRFAVLTVPPGQASPDDATESHAGILEGIGQEARLTRLAGKRALGHEPTRAADYGEATRQVLDHLDEHQALEGLDAVGLRVVHGGDRFEGPALVDDGVVAVIRELEALAPLHNAPSLEVLDAVRARLAGVPVVAVFDTSFHHTLPAVAITYALPPELAARHGLRRYGFHGTSHRYMAGRYARLVGRPLDELRLVTLHLESGCSAAAIDRGRSVETSMGMTPLEGLVMGSRSGDIDPAIVLHLARHAHLDLDAIDELLNKKSGLLGLSGRSHDTRDLVPLLATDDRARLAMEVFVHRVRKYVGAYLAVLGGADAIVFGGGIGEDTPYVREQVCAGLAWCGLVLDPERNRATIDVPGRLSTDDSRLHAHVVPVDEARQIAHEVGELLAR